MKDFKDLFIGIIIRQTPTLKDVKDLTRIKIAVI